MKKKWFKYKRQKKKKINYKKLRLTDDYQYVSEEEQQNSKKLDKKEQQTSKKLDKKEQQTSKN